MPQKETGWVCFFWDENLPEAGYTDRLETIVITDG